MEISNRGQMPNPELLLKIIWMGIQVMHNKLQHI